MRVYSFLKSPNLHISHSDGNANRAPTVRRANAGGLPARAAAQAGRLPSPGVWRCGLGRLKGASYFVAGPAERGMVKWKEAPLPGSLLTQASPPCA